MSSTEVGQSAYPVNAYNQDYFRNDITSSGLFGDIYIFCVACGQIHCVSLKCNLSSKAQSLIGFHTSDDSAPAVVVGGRGAGWNVMGNRSRYEIPSGLILWKAF